MSERNFNDFKFAEAFSSWELQRGSPIIHVSHEKNQKQFRITQKRYLNADSNNIDSSSWFIPINFAHSSNPDFDDSRIEYYFEAGTSELIISTSNIDGFDDGGWFVFNKQQLGFYRVNYDFENWHNIIKVLNSGNYQQIHVLNRAQIVDDVMNFAIDGYVDFNIALGVLAYLRHETDYLPWASAMNYLDRLDHLLLGSEVHQMFHQFVNHLVTTMYDTHGLREKADEDFLNKNAREIAINWSCRSGNVRCLRDSYVEVVDSMKEGKSIPKPLEIAFLCNAIKGTGKTEIFMHFWRKLYESTDQAERLRIIDGLACATDPEIVKSFLESSLGYNSDVNYRLHERVRIFNSVLTQSSIGARAALNLWKENFRDIGIM
jgi:aminopeptidase N